MQCQNTTQKLLPVLHRTAAYSSARELGLYSLMTLVKRTNLDEDAGVINDMKYIAHAFINMGALYESNSS